MADTPLSLSPDYELLFKLVEVLIVFAAVWFINRYMVRPIVNNTFEAAGQSTRYRAGMFASMFFYLIAVVVSLFLFDFGNIALPVLGSLGIAGVIIGLAVKDYFSDIISGFLIFSEESIRVGDIIELDGRSGRVGEITLRVTRLNTFDGEQLTVPNTMLRQMTILNKTISGKEIRQTINVEIDYSSNLRLVLKLCMNVLSANRGVLKEPKPTVHLTAFNPSGINVMIRYWARFDEIPLLDIKSEIIHGISESFSERGIIIPYPQLDVTMREAGSSG
jgi:small-conductance mechanosensitive channel